MKQSTWLELVAWMCELWPHNPLEPNTAKTWWPFVADLDGQQLHEAIRMLALEPDRRFAPSVGELRAAATGHGASDWHDDWTGLVTEMGAGLKPGWRDRMTDIAAAFIDSVGGPNNARKSLDLTSSFVRRDFREHAQALHRKRELAQRHDTALTVAKHIPQLEAGR